MRAAGLVDTDAAESQQALGSSLLAIEVIAVGPDGPTSLGVVVMQRGDAPQKRRRPVDFFRDIFGFKRREDVVDSDIGVEPEISATRARDIFTGQAAEKERTFA